MEKDNPFSNVFVSRVPDLLPPDPDRGEGKRLLPLEGARRSRTFIRSWPMKAAPRSPPPTTISIGSELELLDLSLPIPPDRRLFEIGHSRSALGIKSEDQLITEFLDRLRKLVISSEDRCRAPELRFASATPEAEILQLLVPFPPAVPAGPHRCLFMPGVVGFHGLPISSESPRK
jgi:hypothetical protein